MKSVRVPVELMKRLTIEQERNIYIHPNPLAREIFWQRIEQLGKLIEEHIAPSQRGLDFGGQTRIAYTQDPNLHVLEVTDLEKRGRYTTRRFFDGSKPEYPRSMRCIQGSDAHRLER